MIFITDLLRNNHEHESKVIVEFSRFFTTNPAIKAKQHGSNNIER